MQTSDEWGPRSDAEKWSDRARGRAQGLDCLSEYHPSGKQDSSAAAPSPNYDQAPQVLPAHVDLSWCSKCNQYAYLRKNRCANMDCVVHLECSARSRSAQRQATC